jgi:hypothetical protein
MNNLQLYHKVLAQLCKWLPDERITRMRNLSLLVIGLFLSASVHLSFIIREWPTAGKDLSLVNRLRRFLDNPRLSVEDCYRPVAQELADVFAGKQIRLVIDCTKLGFNHRLMTISIAYRKRTMPLVWSVHQGRKGHVKVNEQLALFEKARRLLPPNSEIWVMGDSGFQYVPLLQWLTRHRWHFVIRQQGRIKIYRAGHGWMRIDAIPLAEGETRVIGWIRLTEKHNAGWFWLILHWQKGEDEPWYLVSDRSGKEELLRFYRVRAWVEEMYGDMKGHGFEMEKTHLDDADRLSRLVLGICLAYTWLITLGSWVVKRGFRHFVDRKDRRDKSYFRIGWDWIKRCLRLDQPVRLHFKPYL